MPAVSVDTFFACLLLVMVVLAAMVGTSTIVVPVVSNRNMSNLDERYGAIAEHLLLYSGAPTEWGNDDQLAVPDAFGLGKYGASIPYEVDIDKVTRLNQANYYCISYPDMYEVLKLHDISLRIEIEPFFRVSVNHVMAWFLENETIHEFSIGCLKDEESVPADLKCYVIAEDYLATFDYQTSNGQILKNVTIPKVYAGSALLAVLARRTYDHRFLSFNVCVFSLDLGASEVSGQFLNLSPLGQRLWISSLSSGVTLSTVYALTFAHYSMLEVSIAEENSTLYQIPMLVNDGPIILVATGLNASEPFVEYVTYPQVPLKIGADFASTSRSNVFAYSHPIMIGSTIFQCAIWLGGPQN